VKYYRIVTAIAFLLVVMILPSTGYGQDAGTGTPTFGSLQNGDFDSVNLQNLNINLTIPVVNHPGRGLGFQYGLAYNSLVFSKVVGSSTSWRVGEGWGADQNGYGFLTSQRTTPGFCLQFPGMTITKYGFTDSAGTQHPFSVQTATSNNCGFVNILSGYATDASGYFMDISSTPAIVRTPDGTKLTFPSTGSIITDVNGNQILRSTDPSGNLSWSDTLGQTVLKIVSSFSPSGLISETDYSRLAVDGTYQTIAKKFQPFNIKTNFGCTGISELTGSGTLVSEIDLPNSQKYLFSYEPTPGFPGYVTGRLQQVTLPTGGTITYQYPGPNGGINCSDGTPLQLTRIVNDGTTSATWNYTRVPASKGGTTTVTAPQLPYDTAANQTVITFDTNSGLETSRKIYQGQTSGNPVQTINTSWTPNSLGTNYTPTSRTVILEDGITQSQVETTYDANGLLQSSKEHDWGSGGPGPVLRTTTLTYLSDPSYVALNIINRLKNKTIADASGAIKFQTDIKYDEAGFVNDTCVTGALQHDDANYGCSFTTRGLPTSVTTYTDAATPSGGVTKNFSYDSVGNLVKIKVNSILQKQLNFSATTQYAFPDSVVSGPASGPQVTTSVTYHLTTGQIATATDENQQVTTYFYNDPGHLDRLTDVIRSDQNHFSVLYNDVSLTVTKSIPIQGTAAVQKITAVDGLGRPVTNTTEDAANAVYSIVKTQYDPVGRPYMSSNPYTSSPQFWTTQQFDALGRPTATLLPDGAQTTLAYATNSATVNDPSGKQRKSIANALGQLVEVDEPGGPDPGTQAATSINVSGAFNSTWVGAGTPHLAATGSALASVAMSDPSSHTFYFDTNQHLCQMSWNSSGWFDQDLTSMTEAGLPLAGSSIAAVNLGGVLHVFYQGANLHIYDMNWTGSVWQNIDMTALTGASAMSGTKMSAVLTGNPNSPMMFYEGTNQHLFTVYWNSSANAWQNADLNALSGATTLMAVRASFGSAMFVVNGGVYLFYIGTNQHLIDINWDGSSRWLTGDLTIASGGAALAVSGSAVTTIASGTSIDLMSFYEGANQHIYSVYWNGGAGAWQTLDFTSWSGATNIAAALTSLANNPVGPHMFYFSSSQHLDDMLWNGSAWVNADLTSLANTTMVPASGSSLSSHGTVAGGTYHIFFEGGNQHVYHTYYNPSASGWFNDDPLVAASNFVVDSGTVSLTIPNGTSNFVATVCYGASTNPICAGQPVNASPGDIANALAAVLNGAGSPVNAVVTNSTTLDLTWRSVGAVATTVAAMTSTSDNPALFPNGSFTSTSGTFSGGIAASNQSLRNPFVATYTYGVFNNLLQVSQGAQTRTYAYDGIGRSTDITTPEAGHVNFQYNAFNQVSQQTDARGVKTNLGYDTLNRLHTIGYDISGSPGVPATPGVTYNYGTSAAQNNNGRLQQILDGLGSETYTYDSLGRATQLQKVINGITYNIGYGYNLSGELTSLTYPSGHVVQQSFDAIGRLCEIAPQTAGCGTATSPYATGYAYNPAFEATGLNFGNGVNATFGFSADRLQMTSLSYVKGTQTLFGLNYFYKQDSTNCPTGAPVNNGQIQCINDVVDSGRNAAYTYEALGRLSNASTKGSAGYPAWNLPFTYDRYGNRTSQGSTTLIFNSATNQVSTLPYDASGNMMNDGINALAYDAAGRMVTSTQSSAVSTYSYDCKNLRVQKVSGGNTTVYIFSGGKVLAEYVNGAAPTAPTREYIYSGSALLAKVEAGTTSYSLADHLSTRMLTDPNGVSLGQQGHFSFGDPWYDTLAGNKWKFTTYERDSESQNDYAMARFYVNRDGRFTSPDPLSGSVGNPQSLNRYAYGANDPINSIDPTGQAVYAFERGFQGLYLSAAQVAAGEGGRCTMDGLDASCQAVTRYIDNGFAHECPHNNCDPIYSAEHGWVSPVRTDPDTGEWQIWQSEFFYLAPSRATPGNPNGAGYRNGRWVPDDVSGDLPMGYHPSFMPGLCCNTGVFPEQSTPARPPISFKQAFHQSGCMMANSQQTFGSIELGIQKPLSGVAGGLQLGKSALGPYAVIVSTALAVDGTENYYSGKVEGWMFSCGPN
jgi:RHS repeat-associated protein